MEEQPLPFIDTWDQVGQILGSVLVAVSVILFLAHVIKLATTREPKVKYDYITESEIGALWRVAVFFLVGAAILANAFIDQIGPMWLIIRMFTTLAVTVVLLVVVKNLLKFYYPFYMEKRLKELRYMPRISPKSGKPMKLLSEEEEDVYLDEGMQAEEEIYSVDYDVWIDEESGYTKIEKYSGHLHAENCPECSYNTFKVEREEVVQKPTEVTDGELIKHYVCGYCGFRQAKSVKVASKKSLEELGEATAAKTAGA
jgi:hypothetical protein